MAGSAVCAPYSVDLVVLCLLQVLDGKKIRHAPVQLALVLEFVTDGGRLVLRAVVVQHFGLQCEILCVVGIRQLVLVEVDVCQAGVSAVALPGQQHSEHDRERSLSRRHLPAGASAQQNLPVCGATCAGCQCTTAAAPGTSCHRRHRRRDVRA